MQFSKIRLTGFKSFVDPTELTIADGLTGVVGPNGCGKSNLLEALRWVMGESRPTAMRGGGMEDVIFAGAASRPARHFAEVALTLDNSQRLAPAVFNQSDKLEIIRRITMDAGSAYKTNGKDARARDVQMLFADASTGAHSPALVRQGQISELINAKPKARRRILEEAAGISGLYQRRHEAELKLRGAETNLLRIDDVIEQLDSQLSGLARQAKQAARYRQIGEDLRRSEGLLLYRKWQEAEQANLGAAAELTEATKAAAAAQGKAAAAARLRGESEAKLPPLREEEAIAGAILQRLQVARSTLDDQQARAVETIETLKARIEQLSNDINRETGLNRDAGETIEKLDWEKAALEKAGDGHEAKLQAAQEASREAAQVMQQQESSLDQFSEDVARLAARHQSAHRLLSDTQTTLARRSEELVQIVTSVTAAQAGLASAKQKAETAVATDRAAQATAQEAQAAIEETEAKRAEMQELDSNARAAYAQAEGEANALNAEVAALQRVVSRNLSSENHLLDDVRAENGFEAALGAALGDDLKAPLIDRGSASGWVGLDDYSQAATLPNGISSLASHITAPAVLSRRLKQVGLIDRADGSDLQGQLLPGQRLVSREGDLWRWDGFRVGADDAPSAAALHLQQINRLADLKESSAKSADRSAKSKAGFEVADAALKAAVAADQTARLARKSADENASAASRDMNRAEAECNILAGKLEALQLSHTRLKAEASAAGQALREAEAGMADLGDLDQSRGQLENQKLAVEAARVTMLSKRAFHDEVRREGELRSKRSQEVTKEVSGWRHRLQTAQTRISELENRKSESETTLTEAMTAPDELAKKREALSVEIEEAETRRRAASDSLAEAETSLRKLVEDEREGERQASAAREARARADAVAEAASQQVDAAAERITQEAGVAPEVLLKQLEADPASLPAAEKIEEDVLRLRRQRDALGAVNLRAEEDASEVSEERDQLAGEKEDLDEAIKKLRSGIASLNKEGRERLLQAFDDVNANFSRLFKHLFGGGEAKLELVESDDPLEAGLEIMCQPPGKKLSTLSLLSGGEQTLTALSLIFAVFLANPSPICVLDEVDAPLDDANVTRFCDLLDEMTKQTDTRFLIITHHAVTMARMDRLYGVTMAEQGVSQLVSVDLRRAEEIIEG